MSSHKGSGHGTKVDLGQNAPTKQEGVGEVPSESLAAESYAEGEDFASNEGIRSENLPSKPTSASKPASAGQKPPSAGRDTSSTSRSGGAPQSSTGTAPSYSQTLKEGGWDDSKNEDGLQRALNAEPGSDDDPSRLAEQQFRRQSGGAGPREKDLKTKTAYDALDSETPS